jgi:hypothetical protein
MTVGFVKHSAEGMPNRSEKDPTELARDQLRREGADPDLPHETRHFLYVPGAKAAQQIARSLAGPKRRVDVETSARKGYWIVAVTQSVAITPAAMAGLRAELEAAATPLGGEYDRWQVVVANG